MKQNGCFQTVPGGREITFQESLGDVVFSAILYGIGYSFFFVAIANLLFVRPLPLVGLVASLVWVAFIVLPLVSGCRRTGIRQHLGNVLSNFFRNRFAEFTSSDADELILGFGCRLGSVRHYFLKIRSDGIKSVDWGPGQGNIPGKDNDWHVALWFDVDSIVFDGGQNSSWVFIVGPSAHKAGREAFGSSFIEFLKTNHVPLTLPPAGLLGQMGEVVELFGPFGALGRITVGTEEYVARPIKGPIKKGNKVVIEEIRGSSIYVRPTSEPNSPGLI